MKEMEALKKDGSLDVSPALAGKPPQAGAPVRAPVPLIRICPNCGCELEDRKCKLFCPRYGCGYYLSCADFY